MNKYEADTRYIFVNTQNPNSGDQVNQIKLNLGTQPIQSSDDSIVKISLQQFNMPCNWWNVNSTNNTFRVVWKTFTHAGTSVQINNVDALLKIAVGNYLTHQQVQNAFCASLKVILDAAVQGGGTTFTCAAIATKTEDYRRSSAGGNGLVKPTDVTDLDNKIFGINVTCSNASFVFDKTPFISSCFMNPTDGVVSLTDSTALTADDQYNDSATLVGGNRSKSFLAITDSDADLAAQNCFSVKVDGSDDHVVNIFGFYPMNTALHTMPYVYMRFNGTVNQVTGNYEEGNTNHHGEVIASHMFAKIERREGLDGDVYYRYNSDGNDYSTIMTANSVQNIEFSLTDSLGRVIPQNTDYTSFLGSSSYDSNSGTINKQGNLFCDFVLKVEKKHIPFQPNALTGIPPPLRKNNEFVQNELINTVPNF